MDYRAAPPEPFDPDPDQHNLRNGARTPQSLEIRVAELERKNAELALEIELRPTRHDLNQRLLEIQELRAQLSDPKRTKTSSASPFSLSGRSTLEWLDSELQRSSEEVSRLQAELKVAQRRLQECEEKASIQATRHMDEVKRLTAANTSLNQRLAQCEQQARVKEQTLQRLQERIAADVVKEDARREREKKLLHEAQKKALKSVLPRDGPTLAIVCAYEEQRRDMAAELSRATKELQLLTQMVQERDNSRWNLEASPHLWRQAPSIATGHPASESPTWEQEQTEGRIRQIQHEAAEQVHIAEARAESFTRRVSELELKVAELSHELQSRPTHREHHQNLLEIESLREQLRELRLDSMQPAPSPVPVQAELSESGVDLEWQDVSVPWPSSFGSPTHASHDGATMRDATNGSTRDQIRRDRDLHRLRIDTLPPHALRLILLDVARELHVQDIADLASAATRVCRTSALAASLHKFASSVFELLDRHRPGMSASPSFPDDQALAACIETLRTVFRDLVPLAELKDFRNAIEAELQKRRGSVRCGTQRICRMMVDEVAELVRAETAMKDLKVSLHATQCHVQDDPDSVLGRMVRHFQDLFSVRSIEGVYPKMNEVYLLVNQSANVLAVLRDLLNLDPKANYNAVLAALRSFIESHRPHQAAHISAGLHLIGDAGPGPPRRAVAVPPGQSQPHAEGQERRQRPPQGSDTVRRQQQGDGGSESESEWPAQGQSQGQRGAGQEERQAPRLTGSQGQGQGEGREFAEEEGWSPTSKRLQAVGEGAQQGQNQEQGPYGHEQGQIEGEGGDQRHTQEQQREQAWPEMCEGHRDGKGQGQGQRQEQGQGQGQSQSHGQGQGVLNGSRVSYGRHTLARVQKPPLLESHQAQPQQLSLRSVVQQACDILGVSGPQHVLPRVERLLQHVRVMAVEVDRHRRLLTQLTSLVENSHQSGDSTSALTAIQRLLPQQVH